MTSFRVRARGAGVSPGKKVLADAIVLLLSLPAYPPSRNLQMQACTKCELSINLATIINPTLVIP